MFRVPLLVFGVEYHVVFASLTGCSAAWLARLTGGQKVGGSNPLSPIQNAAFEAAFFKESNQTKTREIVSTVVGQCRRLGVPDRWRRAPHGACV